MSWYHLTVTLHVLAALLWLGGMFFLAAVGAPILRRVEPPALRAQLFQQLGLGFRRVGWVAIAVLIVTGLVNLQLRGQLSGPAIWSSRWLTVKLAVVLAMVVLSAIHDFYLGPAAGRAPPGSPAALRLRRSSAWLARANALLGLALVVAAVRLTRG